MYLSIFKKVNMFYREIDIDLRNAILLQHLSLRILDIPAFAFVLFDTLKT